jgi:chemotaxis regulatin CheY-phosphate phosphatase CheZ
MKNYFARIRNTKELTSLTRKLYGNIGEILRLGYAIPIIQDEDKSQDARERLKKVVGSYEENRSRFEELKEEPLFSIIEEKLHFLLPEKMRTSYVISWIEQLSSRANQEIESYSRI